jgi:hypothetical protein
MTQLTALYETIRAALAETAFDNRFEVQHVKAAATVAFLLAFCNELTSDCQSTVASRRGTVRA